MIRITKRHTLVVAALGLGLMSGLAANAETITWTDWTAATGGGPGTATGTMSLGSGVTVTYTGELGGIETDTDWTPSTTWAGGNVSNAPNASYQELWMTGGDSYTESITFSQAVTDPTMAFWSLGGPGTTATFDFADGQNFSIQACGPSNLGGTCISQSGQVLSGRESSGTIQFAGTYTSLSFTTPVSEHWFDFTVGAADIATVTPPPVSATPEPSSLALLGTGFAGIIGILRRRIRRA